MKLSEEIYIRPAETEDVAAMALLLEQLFRLEEDFTPEKDRQEKGLSMLLDSTRAIVLVAVTSDNRVVGMCTGQILISTSEGGPALLVEDVVVEQTWRGKGIGPLLMGELTIWAQKHGIRRMQLLADRNNTQAIHFYHNNGWQPTELICLRHIISSDELCSN